MTVKYKRTDVQPAEVLEFVTELDFRGWYKRTLKASNGRLRGKIIRERQPSLKGLDCRSVQFLGNGGDKAYCIASPRFFKQR